MVLKTNLVFFLLALVIISSCKKSATAPSVKINEDVYVAGSTVAKNGKMVATYWKNGIPKKLSDSTSNTYAHAIYVKDTDVYIAGSSINASGFSIGLYWKNGVETKLSSMSLPVEVNGMTVNNGDVYIVGYT